MIFAIYLYNRSTTNIDCNFPYIERFNVGVFVTSRATLEELKISAIYTSSDFRYLENELDFCEETLKNECKFKQEDRHSSKSNTCITVFVLHDFVGVQSGSTSPAQLFGVHVQIRDNSNRKI